MTEVKYHLHHIVSMVYHSARLAVIDINLDYLAGQGTICQISSCLVILFFPVHTVNTSERSHYAQCAYT